MALTDPLIGRMLGDYRVMEILGRGGMARVYRGYDPKLDRYAAIKVIDAHLLSSQESEEEYRARFRREARAIARLHHPNIVGIYQYGEVDALYYMAMVFIEGRDLGQILKDQATRGTRLQIPQVLRIISDTALALDYSHEGGVIHRDVKPSNIMVTPSGHAVLTDFGLALSVPEGSLGNTFGSAHYIAPEQAVSSAQAVPQSDLYSLAIVLYQMLAGKVPFDDPSAMSVALKHISDPPPPIRRFAPDLPTTAEYVLMKALEKDVKKRFHSGYLLSQALEDAFAPTLGIMPSSTPSRPRPLSDGTGSQPVIRRRKTDEFEKIDMPTLTLGSSASQVDRPTWTEKLNGLSSRIPSESSTSTQSLLRASIEAKAAVPPRRRGRGRAAVVALVALIAVIVVGIIVIQSNGDLALGGGDDNTAVVAITDLVIATDVLTETPPQNTPTVDNSPTETPTDAAVAVITDEVSTDSRILETPTWTRTRVPTRTPTVVGATEIVDINTPPSTVNQNTSLVLIYDAQTIVLHNRSSVPININNLRFIRLNQLGREIVFEGIDWQNDSAFLSRFAGGGCYQLWLISLPFQDVPAYCEARFGWRSVGTTRQFWTSSEPDRTFEIRRENQVLATCPTNVGECGFDILP